MERIKILLDDRDSLTAVLNELESKLIASPSSSIVSSTTESKIVNKRKRVEELNNELEELNTKIADVQASVGKQALKKQRNVAIDTVATVTVVDNMRLKEQVQTLEAEVIQSNKFDILNKAKMIEEINIEHQQSLKLLRQQLKVLHLCIHLFVCDN